MFNLKVREFKDDIINYINASVDIPAEVKFLALKDICHQLETAANNQIVLEKQERNRKRKEAETEPDKECGEDEQSA